MPCSVWRMAAVSLLYAAAVVPGPRGQPLLPDAAAKACAAWALLADQTLVTIARTDSRFPELPDALFRAQRARRSCELGLLDLACQDYRAVARGEPRLIGSALVHPGTCEQSWHKMETGIEVATHR
jgi:hypothetical protein